VVFDTNVVVSALLFAEGQLAWLRKAWREGAALPLLAEATVRELMTVLAYPKFRLTTAEIETLLGDYLPFGEVVQVTAATRAEPRCRDPHDQAFVDLAAAGGADFLVTGDRDLLDLRDQLPCAVMTPAAFRDTLGIG
jgi:putative PIN family toxin of toxin-antitoxin system